jgi:uncharacterized membrane protein YgcG
MFARLIVALLAALVLLLPVAARADERILLFSSDISVQPDASLIVTETIRVRAEGINILHGIFRDYPTRYSTWGLGKVVGFEVQDVRRDGAPEPWVLESLFNGNRVRIGSVDVDLPPGEHVYLIRYRTTRQIGFFDDHDELYWNVTGNGWAFPIDRAVVRIALPKPAAWGPHWLYTGAQGSKEQRASVMDSAPGVIRFQTDAALPSYEGFTVSVEWPKDVVAEPKFEQSLRWWLADNGSLGVGLMGLIGVFLYYFYAWKRAGRNPRPGTIVPLFSPPDDLTPAGMRYVEKMGADNRAFAAAVVDLGVRGKLRLVEGEKGFLTRAKTTIEKKGDTSALPPPEAEMMRELFQSGDCILMDDENHARFSAAQSALWKGLKTQYEGKLFQRNALWAWRGLAVLGLAVLGTAIALALTAPISSGSAFYTGLWALAASAASAMLFVWPAQGAMRWLLRGLAILAALIAAAMGVALIGQALQSGRFLPLLVPFLSLPVVISAFSWMAAPTKAGRIVLDDIAGFRQYLSITEEERLQVMHPPEKTPELFEKYLPYAIALKVENQWANRFASVLAAASVAGHAQSFAWYSGHSDPWSDADGFASNMGSSLSSTIASASTAPGSSSGSGGGGSSGGGGGGGGGGGW